MKKICLVIGGSGFLGKNLAISFDNVIQMRKDGLFKNGQKIYDHLEECIEKEEIKNIFNCAVSYNENNLEELNDINYHLPKEIINLTKKYK